MEPKMTFKEKRAMWKHKLDQYQLKWKFRIINLLKGIYESDKIGNIIMAVLHALVIMLTLSLWLDITWKLFLASVGIYFVVEWLFSNTKDTLSTLRRP